MKVDENNKIMKREAHHMIYLANPARYDGSMQYRYCGASGLKLPAVSLGLWHNFGHISSYEGIKQMLFTSFDLGITHFDLANNYGPPEGAAEENLGRVLANELKPYRDELLISTKAGFKHWEGPYGAKGGSRKYLLASLDKSLKRLGLDYVDIFYHHVQDSNTPVEETASALDQAVRSGKALYVGISNYYTDRAREIIKVLKELRTPVVIDQNRYSILDRNAEKDDLKGYLAQEGIGLITYSPLAQGLLTDRYLRGIPEDSRVRMDDRFLKEQNITEQQLEASRSLAKLAAERGQTLAQMALSWILKDETTTSVLIGASKPSQIADCVGCLKNITFTEQELAKIDEIIAPVVRK